MNKVRLAGKGRAASFSFYAKLDWTLVILMNISPVFFLSFFAFAFAGGDLNEALIHSLANLFWSLAALYITSLLIDFIHNLSSCASQPLCNADVIGLQNSLADSVENDILKLLENAECVSGDFSLGARITGVWKQKLILSGGMLAALRNKNRSAICILLHEYAHIKNFDVLIPGLIGMYLINFYYFISNLYHDRSIDAIYVLPLVAYNVMIQLTTIFLISRMREHYADAYVMNTAASTKDYISALEKAVEHKKGLNVFHPSLKSRLKACSNGHKILLSAYSWKIYWVAVAITSWLILSVSSKDLPNLTINSISFTIACIALFFEILRPLILRTSFHPLIIWFVRGLIPGQTVLKYVFLAWGYLAIIVYSESFDSVESTYVRDILGAIFFFGIWKMLK